MVAGFLPMLISFLNSITFLEVNLSILHLAIGCRRRKLSLYVSFWVDFLLGVISSRYLIIKCPKLIWALSLKSSYCSFSNLRSVSFAHWDAWPLDTKVLEIYLLCFCLISTRHFLNLFVIFSHFLVLTAPQLRQTLGQSEKNETNLLNKWEFMGCYVEGLQRITDLQLRRSVARCVDRATWDKRFRSWIKYQEQRNTLLYS